MLLTCTAERMQHWNFSFCVEESEMRITFLLREMDVSFSPIFQEHWKTNVEDTGYLIQATAPVCSLLLNSTCLYRDGTEVFLPNYVGCYEIIVGTDLVLFEDCGYNIKLDIVTYSLTCTLLTKNEMETGC